MRHCSPEPAAARAPAVRSVAAATLSAVAAAILTACGPGPAATSTRPPSAMAQPTTTRSAGTPVPPDAANSAACVRRPQAVATRKPSPVATGPMPARLSAPLNKAAAAAFATTDAPGAVVAVRSRKGTWMKAYGFADLSTKAPMATDVHHRVGSVTKTFTATLIMQLAAEHKVSLSDPISRYVPDVPDGAHTTLDDLITMRSGLADYADLAWMRGYLKDPTRGYSTKQILARALTLPRTARPGAEFEYSNTNYVLLGRVVQKVTGHSLAHELDTRIFGPLHLTGTSWPGQSAAIPEPHAQSYTHTGIVGGKVTTTGHPLTNVTRWNPSWANAAGEIISTAGNLLTWGRALATGQGLLPTTAQVERLASFRPAWTPTSQYGIGLMCRSGWVGHGGDLLDFHTDVYYDTRRDTTIVVEINQNPVKGQQNIVTALAKAIGDPIAPLVAPAPTTGGSK